MAATLQRQLDLVCQEIGAREASHRINIAPLYQRAEALQRELNQIKEASQ